MIHAENALSARSKIRGVAYALTVELTIREKRREDICHHGRAKRRKKPGASGQLASLCDGENIGRPKRVKSI